MCFINTSIQFRVIDKLKVNKHTMKFKSDSIYWQVSEANGLVLIRARHAIKVFSIADFVLNCASLRLDDPLPFIDNYEEIP